MTLLILPVRPGDNNPELKYALRSWEKNLILPYGMKLLTVGYKPSWLSPDIHIEGNRHEGVQANVFDNIMLGSAEGVDEMVGDDCLYMNDDFFCLDPVLQVPVVRRDKTLAEHIALYPQYQNMWFTRSLALTASWLAEQGYARPASYDLHRPLPASPSGMLEALSRWDRGLQGDLPQWRTVYGVLNEVEAIPVRDVKLGGASQQISGSPWVSTSDISWRKYGPMIAKSFQKPSRWES